MELRNSDLDLPFPAGMAGGAFRPLGPTGVRPEITGSLGRSNLSSVPALDVETIATSPPWARAISGAR